MNDNADYALVMKGVTKRFGTRGLVPPLPWRRGGSKIVVAVNEIDLTVRRGQIFGIVGSNGCGKSTVVRIIATLLLHDAGKVTVFGHDIRKEAGAVRRLIARVSVEPSFFKKLSATENLLFTAQTYGLGRTEATAKMLEILQRLGIDEERARRPMEQMSRGMQQKVAVARAFMTSPVLLLLDEPTTGLDPGSKRDVQSFIREVRDSHDATVLLMSHYMAETANLCDVIGVMSNGKLIAEGSLDSILRTAGDGRAAKDLEEAFLKLTGHGIEVQEREAED